MFWEFITMFGEPQFWIGASFTSLLLFFTIPKKTRKYIIWFTFLVLPAVTLSYAASYGLKLIFKIPRPCLGLSFCPSTYSFPSGHASVIFAAMIALAFHYKNKKLGLLLVLFACLVSLSRIMLNVHTFMDIIFGGLIGTSTGFLVQSVYESHYKDIKKMTSEI